MLECHGNSIVNAFRQTLGGFGVIYMLAFVLWCVSRDAELVPVCLDECAGAFPPRKVWLSMLALGKKVV